MEEPTSKLELNRKKGKHQVDAQRERILAAAETLSLQDGLENTRMIDIAAAAGITKMSLYRYFPNRDTIALEIHTRMMARIAELMGAEDQEFSPEGSKKMVLFMIRNFGALRDTYRYMGMFDKLYLDNSPDEALTHWTRDQLSTLTWAGEPLGQLVHNHPQGNRFLMAFSTTIWFLEKLALRGELTWSDQAVPLEEHLKLFEEMIMGYLDRF
jgi:AcrR family transcriptional regulator